MYIIKRLILIWVVTLSFTQTLLATSSPKVSWSEEHIQISLSSGANLLKSVTLRSDQELQNLAIEAVPALAQLVSIQPAFLPLLSPQQPLLIKLAVQIPLNTSAGTYEGTIHIRSQKKTLPQVLKVSITVTEIGLPDENEYEEISPAQVTLTGVSELGFNPVNAIVGFEVTGAMVTNNLGDIHAFHNGWPVPRSSIQRISANQITLTSVLVEGKNELHLVAQDSNDLTIEKDVTLWAGNKTLTGLIFFEDNHQPAPGIAVIAKLGDNQEIMATSTSSQSGVFQFLNLPARTIILTAMANGNHFLASTAANGGQGTVELSLMGFHEPSSIINNDFSLGTTGWEIGTAPVQIIPHQLEIFSGSKQRLSNQNLSAGENMDLLLSTQGEGLQRISRTFQIASGIKQVTVRYQFITTEIPAGYFGTRFNDYFSISIRSLNAGGVISENQSMNSLGRSTFNDMGATLWRETSLAVKGNPLVLRQLPLEDTVQVDIGVTNVGDGFFDSLLLLDLIAEKPLAITQLNLNDIDDQRLQYLSTDTHPYFGGNTRIHGTITIEGPAMDELSSLVLEVIQNGAVVATADLAPEATDSLIRPFGESERVEITTSQLLFNLPSIQGANVNGDENGTLTLRVRATSASAQEVTREVGAIELLTRYQEDNRYGGRDGEMGGDDWAQPSLKQLAEHFDDMFWGDFSNMNGGLFSPHSSHRDGVDVDGWFDGYNARNAATAQQLINYLNDPDYGSNIEMVYISFEQTFTNTFWNAIRDVELDDGRRAQDVIHRANGHTSHFHWRIH